MKHLVLGAPLRTLARSGRGVSLRFAPRTLARSGRGVRVKHLVLGTALRALAGRGAAFHVKRRVVWLRRGPLLAVGWRFT